MNTYFNIPIRSICLFLFSLAEKIYDIKISAFQMFVVFNIRDHTHKSSYSIEIYFESFPSFYLEEYPPFVFLLFTITLETNFSTKFLLGNW